MSFKNNGVTHQRSKKKESKKNKHSNPYSKKRVRCVLANCSLGFNRDSLSKNEKKNVRIRN